MTDRDFERTLLVQELRLMSLQQFLVQTPCLVGLCSLTLVHSSLVERLLLIWASESDHWTDTRWRLRASSKFTFQDNISVLKNITLSRKLKRQCARANIISYGAVKKWKLQYWYVSTTKSCILLWTLQKSKSLSKIVMSLTVPKGPNRLTENPKFSWKLFFSVIFFYNQLVTCPVIYYCKELLKLRKNGRLSNLSKSFHIWFSMYRLV